jgi:hypothetical protein
MATDNFRCYFQNRLIQTGLTGGQLYNDTSPVSVTCLRQYFVRHEKVSAMHWRENIFVKNLRLRISSDFVTVADADYKRWAET